jgi:phosphoribosylaminoimidazole-succinocarboxamide synthase
VALAQGLRLLLVLAVPVVPVDLVVRQVLAGKPKLKLRRRKVTKPKHP